MSHVISLTNTFVATSIVKFREKIDSITKKIEALVIINQNSLLITICGGNDI